LRKNGVGKVEICLYDSVDKTESPYIHEFSTANKKFLPRTCPYCHKRLDATNTSLDHYIPRARGGQDLYSNLEWCCVQCNRSKGSLDPTAFTLLMVSLAEFPADRDLILRKLRAAWRVQ
jgi:5-methylcytosine-specific restriction endonuclease McrA